MNKELLLEYIARFDITQKNLAKAMGISPSTLSAKINSKGGAEFTELDMQFIKARYGLGIEEFNRIFFAELVS